MRIEPLDEVALDRIHAQAMRILQEVGIEVHSPEALALLAQAGQRVDGTRVHFDSEFVMHQLAKAPSKIPVRGRDPQRSLTLGGGSLAHTPVGGPPFAYDRERGRRDGTIADHIELVKLAHASDQLPILQSGTTEA